ncbi:hypothetical protein BREU_1566 [Bifidobacterium reuteri DSM 23975]|uniref:Periplasmic binding protein domain-containing protein n=1 Tax=Bifidobacterium reuteri DSM 23975 TaxID=1437610 RepID=A0A087CSY5_9BIFI|nr:MULTISPECIES: hypothetical protein [Bifidobacterium]KFI86385.1 hypothetical protein BREU_1566 [Bifidobacterium reuteri DSM 23975]TPF94516.1 hypothetical protein BW14_01430 [Bifidobacterium sp. UTBIF-68]
MGFVRRSVTIATAITAACAMVLSLTACSASHDDDADGGTKTTITSDSMGAAALFTPSDGITLNQQTPLNKWAKLTPELTDALVQYGFKKENISHATSDTLDKQSRAIQDYVVNRLSGKTVTDDSGIAIPAENTTVLVAPVVAADDSTRQYGDYVSQELSTESDADEGATDSDDATSDQPEDGSSNGQSSSSTNSNDESNDNTADSDDSTENDDDTQAQAVQRLVSSLKLAQESGMHVVLLANSIEGYKPDAFVSFSDARTIGHLQAQNVAAKLELDKASKDNPKRIEVLLPYTTSDDGDTGAGIDSQFAKEAFQGIWQVLGAYYQKGTVISPSGALTKNTTEDDWLNVAYDIGKDRATAKVLSMRLEHSGSTSTTTRIDGIIAMNDYVASEVVAKLDDLGYTGSAADINPQITISGIIGNITGKKDLARESVPDPVKAPENDDSANDTGSDAANETDKGKDSQWPLVTGYGSYISSIPNVVKGKQWMTGIENRQLLAADIAEVCGRLNTGKPLSDMSSVRDSTVGGIKKVPTLNEPPLAVSASNLKATLIDPGYISLADAGL